MKCAKKCGIIQRTQFVLSAVPSLWNFFIHCRKYITCTWIVNLWSKYLCNPNGPNCALFYWILMFCLLVWPSVKCDKKGRSMLLLFYFYVNAWNSLHKVNPYICQSGWYLGARFILFFLMNNTHWLFYWIGNISVSVVQKSIQHTSLYSLCLLFPVHFNSFNKKCFFKYYFDI